MKVLVTGANGQLGMCLREVLPGAVFTDIDELDITDLSAIRSRVAEAGIDTIVNCAAYTDVEGAEDHPESAKLLNATAVGYLARAMKEVDGLLIHISTDYIFDGMASEPIPETALAAPLSVYGRTKWQGEEEIRHSGVRHVILRTAWLYSEYGRNFVKTMLRLTAEKPSLKVVSDQKGTPTYARDLAGVIVILLEMADQVGHDGWVLNYTDEGSCSWWEFACAIAWEAGHTSCDIRPCTTAEYPTKAHRPAYSVLDKSAIKEVLGIEIPHWRDALRNCLQKLA